MAIAEATVRSNWILLKPNRASCAGKSSGGERIGKAFEARVYDLPEM
jgi:hypothetical protein